MQACLQASNSSCSSNLKQAAQELLATFAAPIIAQEDNATYAAGKYQVGSYDVPQDIFLYDHAKVSALSFISLVNIPLSV